MRLLIASPKQLKNSGRCTPSEPSWERSPRCVPLWYAASTSRAKRPSQSDSSCTRIFECCPRHQVRMLVPERGEPTIKIGLFINPRSIQLYIHGSHREQHLPDPIVTSVQKFKFAKRKVC